MKLLISDTEWRHDVTMRRIPLAGTWLVTNKLEFPVEHLYKPVYSDNLADTYLQKHKDCRCRIYRPSIPSA